MFLADCETLGAQSLAVIPAGWSGGHDFARQDWDDSSHVRSHDVSHQNGAVVDRVWLGRRGQSRMIRMVPPQSGQAGNGRADGELSAFA